MKRRAIGLALLAVCISSSSLAINGAEVGIYGTGVWTAGIVALEHFLDWKGLTHERFAADDANTLDLSEYYETIVIPGGDFFGYETNLDENGEAHVRDFVSGGGGYLGICGGGYFAADSVVFNGTAYDFPLDLFDGVATGPLVDITTTYTMTSIDLNQANPVNEYQPPSIVTLYSGGSAFYPHAGAWIDTVGTYADHNDDCATVSFFYGDGRVVLMGPHPEIEEDSDRDGTVYGEELDDQGSDWGFLWSVMDWVMGRTISDSTGATPVVLEPHAIDDSFNGPGGIDIFDVDGDGWLDVLAAGYSGNEVAWWHNDGGEPLSWTKQTIQSGFTGAIFVDAGDLDGDLNADVAGAAWFLGEVAWWRNDGGDPISWTKQTIDNAANAHEVFVCDVNQDGFQDVLAALAGNDAIVWYRNDGESDPGWTAYTISDSFAGARSARIGDFDSDGDNDVVGASLDGNEVTWWESDGGEPIHWTEHTLTSTFGGSHMVRVQDVDGDSDPDILAAAFGVNTIALWRNDGGDPLTWTRQNIDTAFDGAVGVEPADIDGDGDIDVLGTAQPSDDIAWWRNDGGDPIRWKKKSISQEFPQVWPLGSGDLDSNGTTDLVAGGFEADEIRCWMNREQWLVPAFEARPPSGHAPLALQLIDTSSSNPPIVWWRWDLDGDGSLDSEARNPSWTYVDPGAYTVTMEVSNGVQTETLTREGYVSVFDGESALLFDGVDDYALCDASPTLNLTDAMTVEAWINPSGWGKAGTFGYGRVVDKTNFALYLNGEGSSFNPHSLLFVLRTENGPLSISSSPDSSIVLGCWQHVAATYDSAGGSVHLYIDSEDQTLTQTSQPAGAIQDNQTIDLMIGNSPTGYTFDGVIDELRLWCEARTESEIAQHMDGYLEGTEQNLVGYWSMNEGNGAAIGDGTASGNDGSIRGALWTQGRPVDTTPAHEPGPRHGLPARLVLYAQHPNPCCGTAFIGFELPMTARVSLRVYDIAGRMVRSLVEETVFAGRHHVVWDGTDQAGAEVSPGVYLYRMDAAGRTASRRGVMVR